MIPHVVTGMPRSSTKWTAQVLTRAGFPTTHEYIFDRWNGVKERAQTAQFGDCSWIAAPFLGDLQEQGVSTILLVRDPLAVVSSVCGPAMPGFDLNVRSPFMDWVESQVGDLGGGPLPLRGMRWWIRWTRMAAEHSNLVVRGPLDGEGLGRVSDLFGKPPNSEALSLDPINATPSKPLRLTWENFPQKMADEARELYADLLSE